MEGWSGTDGGGLRRRRLLIAPIAWWLVAATSPKEFSVLGPVFGTRTDGVPAERIVARAKAALGRPPAPLRRIHTEGTLPGHGIRDASIAAKRDWPIALDLALASRMTGDRRHLDRAGRYLLAWADVYRPSFNPIDETGFDALVMAYDLVEADLPAASRRTLDAFWRSMATGYLDEMEGRPKNARTNWQSHRVKLAAITAFQVGEAALIRRARDAFRRQIESNLRADGSTFDFEERDALHYVTYSLDPLMMAALAAQANGERWFDWRAPTGASLPRSLDWLARYARGELTHVEFVRSRIAFDRERAAAGQKRFGPHPWDPAESVGSFALASRLDPRFTAVRDALMHRTGVRPADWLLLDSGRADVSCAAWPRRIRG